MKLSAFKHKIALSLGILLAMVLATGCASQPSSLPPQEPPFSATGQQPPPREDSLSLLFTLPNIDTAYRSQLAEGVQDRCDQLFIQVEMHNSHNDLAAQLSAVETFVAGGGQLVLAEPIEYAPFRPLKEQLENIGVPLLTFGPQAGNADIGLIVSDFDTGKILGQEAGRWLTEEAAGATAKAGILVLEYTNTEGMPQGLAAGIVTGIAEYLPEAEAIRCPLPQEEEALAEALLALLEENPKATVFLGVDDRLSLAAASIVADSNPKKPERFFFGGIGASEEGLEALYPDSIFRATINLLPYENGRNLVDGALAAKHQTALPPVVHPIIMKLTNELN